MGLNEKTPARKIKDDPRSLVDRLAEALEKEYGGDAGDLIDPKVLRFILDLQVQAAADLEAALSPKK